MSYHCVMWLWRNTEYFLQLVSNDKVRMCNWIQDENVACCHLRKYKLSLDLPNKRMFMVDKFTNLNSHNYLPMFKEITQFISNLVCHFQSLFSKQSMLHIIKFCCVMAHIYFLKGAQANFWKPNVWINVQQLT